MPSYNVDLTPQSLATLEELPDQQRSSSTKRKIVIGVGILVVLAVVGVVLGVTLSKKSSSSNTSASSNNTTVTTPTPSINQALLTPTATSSSGKVVTAANPTSDPESMTPALTMLAIGDWGGTTGKASGTPGSCCSLYTGTNTINKSMTRYLVDFYSQNYIATLMAKSAAQLSPSRIIAHGDNFYWNGVGSKDVAYRFQTTFEEVYNQASLKSIKWVNVAGNHDVGGADFICGDSDNNFVECSSTTAMLQALNAHFNLQANYTSPNGDRWLMKDHYYVERVSRGGVSVDIFNLDTNYADSHGAMEICCQCYGYAGKLSLNSSVCDNVSPGQPACAGGSTDMYNACYNTLVSWANDSLTQATRDIAASTADFKIINTHYSPHYHMNPTKMLTWYELVKNTNVQLWMNGHTHGFSHDIAKWGTHFIENGAGGGIISQSASAINNTYVENQWVAKGTPYGYFEMSFSKDWLKVQFVSFGSDWVFGGLSINSTTEGSLARGHCWYIPSSNYTATGAKGVECKASVDGDVGQPIHNNNSESAGLLTGATPSNTRRNLIYGVIGGVAVVAVGVTAASIFVNGSNSASTSSGSVLPVNTTQGSNATNTDRSIVSPNPNAPAMPDPETQTAALTMLAIGDWGSTTGKANGNPGSCCKLYNGAVDTRNPRYKVDYYAQKYVSSLLAQSAAQLSPVRIIGHGDNMYWDGVGSKDVGYRFQDTFEDKYSQPSLKGIKWINVAGNHDIGGAGYICGEQDNQFIPCKSTDDMLYHLNDRFNLQKNYVSPNGDRWSLKDHYYVERVSKNGVSVDIFNLDTNYADSHGASEICCQCYGYATDLKLDPSVCDNVAPGNKACAGGSLDMYQSCMKLLTSWATDSLTQATRDIAASTADFKIINTHYSPHYHMNPEKMQIWYNLCKSTNVQVWFNGHTHGFAHDISTWGTHFFENGAGGGIISQSPSEFKNDNITNAWIAVGTPYGFMELSFTKEWLKVQFASFAKDWVFGGTDYSSAKEGTIQRGHCYYIPNASAMAQGVKSVKCSSSIDGEIEFTKRKWFIIGGGIVLAIAAVGVTVGILVSQKSSNGSGSSTNNSNSENASSKDSATTTAPTSNSTPSPSITTSDGKVVTPANPTSNPENQTPVLTMLAVGDWGSTTGKESGTPGSCCVLYKGTNDINTSLTRYKVDFWSQKYIATLMAQSAAQLKPSRIISHGDNMYWNGLGSLDVNYRFQTTFEEVYNQPSLAGIKWLNVAGNHDIGGANFICGEEDNKFVECSSTTEMLKYLNERFDLQASYKSPNSDRWAMAHYFVERVSKGGVTVDIFNLDTNYADSHGARQVCCQCYGYSTKYSYDASLCNNVDSGDKACAGGSTDMYSTCMNTIAGWAADSLKQAKRDIVASDADFKIINTHYSPHYHMSPTKMQDWYDLCKSTNVQLWMNGHTHGFNHDISTWGTHFVENGGGGGIVTETSSGVQSATVKNQWIAGGNPYGFFELSFTKDWLKIQFATFDSKWSFGGTDYSTTTQGSIQRGHCWFIPSSNYTATGARGVECKSSVNSPSPVNREGDSLLPTTSAPSSFTSAVSKKSVLVGAAVVVGVTTAAYLLLHTSGAVTDATQRSIPSPTPRISLTHPPGTDSPSAAMTNKSLPASDPETQKPVFSMLAIGDWGATYGKQFGNPGSCCRMYDGKVNTRLKRYMVDYYSQNYVAHILAQSAAEFAERDMKPAYILGHGDNFYWNGVGSWDVGYRFADTFEQMYSQPSLKGIKWLNVVGNHDIAGSSYLCGHQEDRYYECTSQEEMLYFLNRHFTLQQEYKSPNDDRWVLRDHYYVESYEKDGVSVDIFNLDTNHADSHGARQICCQCFGYSAKLGISNAGCEGANEGMPTCMGGNVTMYRACMDEIESWSQDSYNQAERDIKASTATFKIVNTHYSPHYHMSPPKYMRWYKLLQDGNVNAWFNGHTHGFSHDRSAWGTHFFENGGGGGIRTDTAVGEHNDLIDNQWAAAGNPYGFMELTFSPDWLKVQWVSFDKDWVFGGFNLSATVYGGIARGHCWFIPNGNYTASQGVECKDSIDHALGAPLR
ncbi:calcineurin-like phosphoesterase [Thraustotheca clavata]|uniref:Calcineurin-like phosphoesterase n=1 Tax=Thraustotheca clavata TaxID=74557 RepID=A0A1V9ZDM7_9STRA|nr:calcineurin-like phosphoesterase [Thraustotheca clavata]